MSATARHALGRRPKRPTHRPARRRVMPYLLFLPAVIAVALVMVGPMLIGVVMSFLQLTQFTIGNWVAAPFAGLANFRLSLNINGPIARNLLRSFGVTCAYTVAAVGISWVFGVAGATFLTDRFRGRGLVRSLFLLPYAMPAYVGVIVWSLMFQQNGAVNTLLGHDLHLVSTHTFWLAQYRSFGAIVVTSVWRTWPFSFLLLLAGMQGIPTELYEAARVDGSSRWQEFRWVTLPSIRDVSLLLILITGFWTFNDFTTPFIMFSTSPPPAANLISLQIYTDSFVDFNFGLGAAMSVLMIIFLFLVSLVYMRVSHMKIGDLANA